jgi:hypothetical protein
MDLTKMDWNNDGLYDRLTVTLGCAKVLARTLKRMHQIAPKPYEFRFFTQGWLLKVQTGRKV